jgi:hypothetical protein
MDGDGRRRMEELAWEKLAEGLISCQGGKSVLEL